MSDDMVCHIKRGSFYRVLTRDAELQSATEINEGKQLTVYQGMDGKIWVRPTEEFEDGRFMPIKETIYE